MFSNIKRLWPWNDSATLAENGPPSQSEAPAQSQAGPSSSVVIDCPRNVYCAAFLADREHVVSGGEDGKIRRWWIGDGREVGAPMDAGSAAVRSVAVSRDGRWIVCGAEDGSVQVWDAATHARASAFQGHSDWVRAVDVSPDATKIATGSDDWSASVWSLSTGARLLRPWEHSCALAAVKFSPDGRRVATATAGTAGVWVYHAQDGRLLFNVPITLSHSSNGILAWASDGGRLFVLSRYSCIHCIDTFIGTTLAVWAVHSTSGDGCIALASDDSVIATSSGSSVSFWDITTQVRTGSVVENVSKVRCMALSDNFNLATCGDSKVSIRNIYPMIPPRYAVIPLESLQNVLQEPLRLQERSGHEIARLEEVIQRLSDQLSNSQHVADEATKSLRSHITRASAERAQLRQSNEHLRSKLANSQREQNELLRSQETKANDEIAKLTQANQELRGELVDLEEVKQANQMFRHTIRVHEGMRQCEALHAQGRTFDAAEVLLDVENTLKHIKADRLLTDWLTEFTTKCIAPLEKTGDEASGAKKWKEAAAAYAAALSLGPPTQCVVLTEWARAVLTDRSAREALDAAGKFKVPTLDVYRVVCTILEEDGRFTEIAQALRRMQIIPLDNSMADDQHVKWESGLRERCVEQLVKLGDGAGRAKEHADAIKHYSDALSLRPTHFSDILLRRSNELVELDPSSHLGYEQKHAALHELGYYREAFKAFQTMLSKLESSSDAQIRELRRQYLDVTPLIQKALLQAASPFPPMLVDTTTGCFYGNTAMIAFEELAIFDCLRSSMTTRATFDHGLIRDEVDKYYRRYGTLSHRWDHDEGGSTRV